MKDLNTFIRAIPKAELHLHIEGTLDPEFMFKLAERNKFNLPYRSIDELTKAYQFQNLQSFLDLYYQGAQVLQKEEDFYELTWRYLERCAKQNIVHTEIFFDPQTHTARGIDFATVVNGISQALCDANQKLGISSYLIMCFLRDLSEEQAFHTLEQAMPFQDKIKAIGLDSAEKDHPPQKFQRIFEKARALGFLTVAHAGEEGPADYIWQAINLLKVKRVDHGVRCLEDKLLLQYLAEHQIPLTVCPLSNIKLCVCNELKAHPLKEILDQGLCVTINSDDPAYFGGYLEENYLACAEALNLTAKDIYQLAKNSIQATFLDIQKKNSLLKEIDRLYFSYA